MPSFDAIRMRHMREAAAAALQMAAGYERPELSRNLVLAMALTRCGPAAAPRCRNRPRRQTKSALAGAPTATESSGRAASSEWYSFL